MKPKLLALRKNRHYSRRALLVVTVFVCFVAVGSMSLAFRQNGSAPAAPEKAPQAINTISSTTKEAQTAPSEAPQQQASSEQGPNTQTPPPAATVPNPPSSTKTAPSTFPYIPPSVSRIMLLGTTTCSHDINTGKTVVYARPIGASAIMLGDTSNVSVSWSWEFEGDISNMTGIPSGTVTDKVSSGQRSVTLSYFFQASGTTAGFKYRIKSIAPNVVMSDWQVVSGSGTCG